MGQAMEEQRGAVQVPGLAWAGLTTAGVALVVRFFLVGDTAFTYNEATYVELAGHPWYSSYYPDALFLRHPPLAFLLLWIWTGLFGTAEWVVRLPSLLACAAGVAMLWRSIFLRGGWVAATVCALVLAAAFPLHAYGLQATMYPYAFLCAAGAVHERLAGRSRREGVWLAGFALTHLFGFLFLTFWLWEHRTSLRKALKVAGPAFVWLLLSVPVAVGANRGGGDVMRLGPLGQLLRGGSTAAEAATGGWVVHVAVGALALLCLNPLLVARTVGPRRAVPVWSAALGLLCVYFFLGAPYPRYALLAVPFALGGGLLAVTGGRFSPGWTCAVVGMALLSMPAGFLYLESGPDPRAEGDVPGAQAWNEAVGLLPPNATVIATSGPTATAYYLGQTGFAVTSRDEAPYRIVLSGPRDLDVRRVDKVPDLDAAGGDAWILPTHWKAGASVAALGGAECGTVRGLVVYSVSCP